MHSHSRRSFLRQTLGACFTGAAVLDQAIFRAARARAQAPSALPKLFDLEKLADGVYAAVARPVTMLNCNAAIFENSTDILIMDTHSKPSAVASLVRQIRDEITPKPVRYVVASHFHWDHSQGTPAYKRIAPHADIVASAATRKLMDEHTVPRLKASFEEIQKSMASYKEKLAAAKTPEEKAYYQRVLAESRDYLAEMKAFTPELPNVTLTSDLIIHDKSHDLHLAFRGRGHTSGDVIVWCPQKRVVATGDLLHSFFPFIADGYPLEWPRTLLKVAELDFTRVAGGHGTPHPSKDRLHQMANYIEELAERVAVGKRNRTLQQLQAEILPASLRTLTDGGYGQYAAENNLKYRVFPPSASVATVVADSVSSNIAQIFATLEKT